MAEKREKAGVMDLARKIAAMQVKKQGATENDAKAQNREGEDAWDAAAAEAGLE
jgi:hypothetical protein